MKSPDGGEGESWGQRKIGNLWKSGVMLSGFVCYIKEKKRTNVRKKVAVTPLQTKKTWHNGRVTDGKLPKK